MYSKIVDSNVDVYFPRYVFPIQMIPKGKMSIIIYIFGVIYGKFVVWNVLFKILPKYLCKELLCNKSQDLIVAAYHTCEKWSRFTLNYLWIFIDATNCKIMVKLMHMRIRSVLLQWNFLQGKHKLLLFYLQTVNTEK